MIAVVVPTIRPDKIIEFEKAWRELFEKHDVRFIVVTDGDKPQLVDQDKVFSVKDIMGKYADIIPNRISAVRSLGFAYVAKFLPEVEYIITLDDDVLPIGDPIQDHIDTLNCHVSISWSVVGSTFTRGFPYGVRSEAEVVLSHGVWEGVHDFDAPTQLVMGNPKMVFGKMPIPKGCLFPMCGMNLAFKRKVIEMMYFAPRFDEWPIDRFDDIWCGILAKREIDKKGWAVVTGAAKVLHQKASNVYKNLQKEALGIELNEGFWQGKMDHPYFKRYLDNYKRWKEFING